MQHLLCASPNNHNSEHKESVEESSPWRLAAELRRSRYVTHSRNMKDRETHIQEFLMSIFVQCSVKFLLANSCVNTWWPVFNKSTRRIRIILSLSLFVHFVRNIFSFVSETYVNAVNSMTDYMSYWKYWWFTNVWGILTRKFTGV